MGFIYLDYNATTPLAPTVAQVVQTSLLDDWGNPCSSYPYGQRAKAAIDKARTQVAGMLNAPNSTDIIFTSGGTEANNMVVFGAVQYFHERRGSVSARPHIITTLVEHDSVQLPVKHLQEKGDADATFVAVGVDGQLAVEDVLSQVRPDTCLVTIMLANNETGVLMPLSHIGRELRRLNEWRSAEGLVPVLLHTDAAQAVGKVAVDVVELGVDYLTVVGHKFYGPRVGCLYARDCSRGGPPVYPLLYGGGQERGYRPGTENTPMIAGLGEAASLVSENLASYTTQLATVRDYLELQLKEAFGEGGVAFNCSGAARLPNTCSVSFVGRGLNGGSILSHCRRVQASIGAACHSQNRPSGILLASGVPAELARSAVRLSVGRETTKEDMDLVVEDLRQAVNVLQQST